MNQWKKDAIVNSLKWKCARTDEIWVNEWVEEWMNEWQINVWVNKWIYKLPLVWNVQGIYEGLLEKNLLYDMLKDMLEIVILTCFFNYWFKLYIKQGQIHSNSIADIWAGAVMQKTLGIQKCDGLTDIWTDLPTNTARCRVACPRLKINIFLFSHGNN